jgi:hypothetical protein
MALLICCAWAVTVLMPLQTVDPLHDPERYLTWSRSHVGSPSGTPENTYGASHPSWNLVVSYRNLTNSAPIISHQISYAPSRASSYVDPGVSGVSLPLFKSTRVHERETVDGSDGHAVSSRVWNRKSRNFVTNDADEKQRQANKANEARMAHADKRKQADVG